jgi:hypothetical protein
MATLHSQPYPGNWQWAEGEDFDLYDKRIDALFAAIPEDRIIRFGVADGHACYYVRSFRPLVLQHIPYMDAWQVPYAMIRGLRLADVEAQIERASRLDKLFSIHR